MSFLVTLLLVFLISLGMTPLASGATLIHVSATTGSDLNDGSAARPVKTIKHAMHQASVSARPSAIIVDSDSHFLGSEPLKLISGVSVLGGYARGASWTKAPGVQTKLFGGTTAVIARNISMPTEFSGFNVTADSAKDGFAFGVLVLGRGGTSVALYAQDAGQLILKDLTLTAKRGGNGGNGVRGSRGNDGKTGDAGDDATAAFPAAEQSGGIGGMNCAPGGKGGNGALPTHPGHSGETMSGGASGGNGGAASTANIIFAGGANGLPGASGQNAIAQGPNGVGGMAEHDGAYGSLGSQGQAGGGGGGGSGGILASVPFSGAGGGGGGSGGCGGNGGGGGYGGGSSVSMVVLGNVHPRSEFASMVFNASDGGNSGNGGSGGAGGAGGPQGRGGAGLIDPDSGAVLAGAGGDGGRGGDGASGGTGGGGGGGVSCQIFYQVPPVQIIYVGPGIQLRPLDAANNPVPPDPVRGSRGAGGAGGRPNGGDGYQASICPGIETKVVDCTSGCAGGILNRSGGVTVFVSSLGNVEGVIVPDATKIPIQPHVSRVRDVMAAAARADIIRMRFENVPVGRVELMLTTKASRINVVYVQLDSSPVDESVFASTAERSEVRDLMKTSPTRP